MTSCCLHGCDFITTEFNLRAFRSCSNLYLFTRNFTNIYVVRFAARRMNNPDPILQLKGSISVLHSYFQPELTRFFFSLPQVSPKEEINKHGFNQPFGLIVQIKVLKSIQKISVVIYKKRML